MIQTKDKKQNMTLDSLCSFFPSPSLLLCSHYRPQWVISILCITVRRKHVRGLCPLSSLWNFFFVSVSSHRFWFLHSSTVLYTLILSFLWSWKNSLAVFCFFSFFPFIFQAVMESRHIGLYKVRSNPLCFREI